MSSPADWVLASIQRLRAQGNWTGRIHVQKLLFTVSALELARPPFRFSLYHYGPYSRELDWTFAELEADGLVIRSYPQPGYGPQYALDRAAKPGLENGSAMAVQAVAEAFSAASSQQMERIATCFWVMKKEGLQDDRKIVERVREIKPQYDENTIRESLSAARILEQRVTRAQ